ncbi:MAG TPA: hypothetical protein VM261_17565 [Kofleriaceae bacterium]|nr:hypothetical protein [Kofleriaceae bacterium]
MLGLVVVVLAGCASAHGDARTATPSACDATGVWRIDLGAGEIFEVTVDPALMRVDFPEHSIGADAGLAVAVDVAACRLHVVQRTTQHYEEGYGDTDTTLRLSLRMRGSRTTVTGTRHMLTLDPHDETSVRVRGTAVRRARWSVSDT